MLIIIGEKINTVNPRVRRAVEERDAGFIKDLALAQAKAGADVIDVNVGSRPGVEPSNMRWAVELIQKAVDLPLAIDSPNPHTIRAGLQVCRHKERAWANSVTLEKARLEALLPVVRGCGCWVVGLCMDERGVPPTAAGRVEVAERLVDEVTRQGVSRRRLYLDALVEPISVQPMAALTSLETLQMLRSALPDVKTVICLSGISFGLPARRLLNRTYLTLLLHAGVDAILLDPLDGQLIAALKASQALLGHDAHGLEYIAAYRSKQLG
jgi:cobalamin-dependent methionine synthase I